MELINLSPWWGLLVFFVGGVLRLAVALDVAEEQRKSEEP